MFTQKPESWRLYYSSDNYQQLEPNQMSLNYRINKFWYINIVKYYSAIKRKKAPDRHNMHEPQMPNANEKKIGLKGYILY